MLLYFQLFRSTQFICLFMACQIKLLKLIGRRETKYARERTRIASTQIIVEICISSVAAVRLSSLCDSIAMQSHEKKSNRHAAQ